LNKKYTSKLAKLAIAPNVAKECHKEITHGERE